MMRGSSSPTQRIDAHHHLWDLTVREQPWTEPFPVLARSFLIEDLLPELDATGIDGTVVVQTVDLEAETPELLALAAVEPRILGVVGWVDLQREDVRDQINRLRKGPGGNYLVGIRHGIQSETDPGFLARPAFRRGLATLAEQELVYDMLVRPDQLPAVVEAVEALPNLRVVLDHCGKPDLREALSPSWQRDIKRLAESPGVAVKLSGLVTEADHGTWTIDTLRPAADTVLEAFGPSRVMLGSDWPACLPAATYHEVMAAADALIAGVSPSERSEIQGGTAANWYRLAAPAAPSNQ